MSKKSRVNPIVDNASFAKGLKLVATRDRSALAIMGDCYGYAAAQINEHGNITPLCQLYNVIPRHKGKMKAYAIRTLPVNWKKVHRDGKDQWSFDFQRGKNTEDPQHGSEFWKEKIERVVEVPTLKMLARKFAEAIDKHGYGVEDAALMFAGEYEDILRERGDTANHLEDSRKAGGDDPRAMTLGTS
jgi:hypothetical protein